MVGIYRRRCHASSRSQITEDRGDGRARRRVEGPGREAGAGLRHPDEAGKLIPDAEAEAVRQAVRTPGAI
jgi:hypothetical protein